MRLEEVRSSRKRSTSTGTSVSVTPGGLPILLFGEWFFTELEVPSAAPARTGSGCRDVANVAAIVDVVKDTVLDRAHREEL